MAWIYSFIMSPTSLPGGNTYIHTHRTHRGCLPSTVYGYEIFHKRTNLQSLDCRPAGLRTIPGAPGTLKGRYRASQGRSGGSQRAPRGPFGPPGTVFSRPQPVNE